jgi:hypothetical protein
MKILGHVLRRALPLGLMMALVAPVAIARAATVTGTLDPAAPNGLNGWYKSAVTVTWTSDDPDYTPVPATETFTTDGPHTATTQACNLLLDCVTGSVSFKIDATAPTINIIRPVNAYERSPLGVVDLQGNLVTAVYDCADATAGIAPGKGPGQPCDAPVASGQPLLPVPGGTENIFTVTATDLAGNVGSVSSTYRVNPAPPDLVLPAADETTNDHTPVFRWNNSADSSIARYELWVKGVRVVANIPQGACVGTVCQTAVTAPDLGPPFADLKTPLDWYVKAFGVDGPQKDSSHRTITIDPSVPGPPTLTGGPVGTTPDATPTFSWDGAGPQFRWQVTGPGDAVVRGPVTTGSLQAQVQPALPNGVYKFEVRQAGANSLFGSAAVVSFTVDGSSAAPTAGVSGGSSQVAAQPPSAPSTLPALVKTTKKTKKGSKSILTPRTINAKLLTPKAAAKIRDMTPTLRWKKRPKGAGIFNLQIFQGTKKVLSRFPTALHYTVPAGVLKPGKRYIWRVWPYFGPARGYPKNPLGLSYFDVLKTKKAAKRK